jgi:hypothetical protein
MKQFRQYSLFIDYSSGPEEAKIFHMLTMICATTVGKLLLDALESQSWIIPGQKELARCHCAGLTLPMTPGRQGHEKNSNVFFEVTDQPMLTTPFGIPYQYYSDDDRLFHELVHAYRMGRIGYSNMDYSTTMTNYLNVEEFLAVHMQNVYLSDRGNPRFYLNTSTMKAVSKGDAYASFVKDKEALRMFRYFVQKDPLVAKVAALKEPVTSFNPWRDAPILDRI